MRKLYSTIIFLLSFSAFAGSAEPTAPNKDGTEILKEIDQKCQALIQKKQVRSEEIKSILELAATSFAADPLEQATEFILDLKKAFPKAFKKALESLPAEKKKSLDHSIKTFEKELQSGNG